MNWYQTFKFKYSLAGALFGCFFPIIAVCIDVYRLNMGFNWPDILEVQRLNPLHYIINTAPLFLGVFAYIGGVRQDKIEEINNSLEEEIERQIVSLKDSTKQLEESLHFKEIFLANMSHEIRTPMNGILGMLNLIKEDVSLTEELKEHINTIHESSTGLMVILNDVLDLSKLEVGMMEVKPEVVNIHEVINKVLRIFLAIAKQKNIQLSYQINDNIPVWLKVDRHRLSQIISNLVGNAIKFTHQGKITLELDLVKKNEEQAFFKISVQDTGIGLNEAEQKVIFNEFLQLEYHNAMGTGLGLAICKQLSMLLGGEIGVISEKGKGSTFWFTFEAKLEKPLLVASVESLEGEEPQFDLNILLVEDNKINQKVACLTLQKLGCKIEIAENGLEALEMFSPSKYDLILMDVQMPKMDGLTATKALKKQEFPVPPIIGLSANAMAGDAERYKAEGMDDYISKPIIIEDLKLVFNRWFPNKL